MFRIIVFLFCLTSASFAQLFTTAETLGKGKQAVLFSENRQFSDGIESNLAFGQYIVGLTKRFDLYAGIGGTRIFRQDQAWVAVGGNFHIARVEKVDVSFFNIASLPLHRQQEASTVLLNSAIIVSRNVTRSLALYSGVNSLWPIGAKDRGIFTPLKREINVPIGAGIFLSEKWGIFAELDIGHLKTVGLGIAYVF